MVVKGRKKKVVAVSGGFDPMHFGHVRYLQEARKLGDSLVVILNNDHWLKAKKGFVFMPEKERVEVLEAMSVVDRVVLTKHKKGMNNASARERSVALELARIKPAIFANGGDRDEKNAADPHSSLYWDIEVCKKLGTKMVFGVGAGGKVQSSSWLTKKVASLGTTDIRPWGYMHTHKAEPTFWIKTIHVAPGRRLSLQEHKYRAETWVCVEGEVTAEIGRKKLHLKPGGVVTFPARTKHRLSSEKGGAIVEVAFGSHVHEDDIVRYEDDFGRK